MQSSEGQSLAAVLPCRSLVTRQCVQGFMFCVQQEENATVVQPEEITGSA